MSTGLLMFLICGFVAVVLLIESFFAFWSGGMSPEVRRVTQRLSALSPAAEEAAQNHLSKQRVMSHSPALQKLLLKMPFSNAMDRLLQQSGSSSTVLQLLSLCMMCGVTAFLLGLLLRWPWAMTAALGAGVAVIPVLKLIRSRNKRLRQMEVQLPEAMDLISRALRAGHAFPSALAMVAVEAQEPIAGEFRIVSDEIAFGIALDTALNSLAVRLASPDMRYFVMAVIIQRDTGGNLAELLDKLSSLVRERFKLFAKVRALAAEGKLSAWILTGLPFFVAGALQLTNPNYLALLLNDPAGIRLVVGAIVLMAIGVLVMWRIIHIRV